MNRDNDSPLTGPAPCTIVALLATCCSLLLPAVGHGYIDETVIASSDRYTDATMPAISDDGRYIAYSQPDVFDWNSPPNFYNQIWRKDLITGDIVLVSRTIGDGDPRGNQGSYNPTISDDGNLIVFESDATDLVTGDVSPRQVYVRDVEAGTTQLVSRASGTDGEPADQGSGEATISGNGRFVSFLSGALNLDPIDQNPDNRGDVFVRDLELQTTDLVGCEDGAPCVGIEEGTWTDDGAAISDDGRYVLFRANSPQLEGGQAPCYYDWFWKPDPCYRLYVRDRIEGTTELVSRANGPEGAVADGMVYIGGISGDGRTVSFTSIAGNLGPDDTPDAYDAWVRDLDEDRTLLIGRADGADGPAAERPPPYLDHPDAALWASAAGAPTDDGSVVVFTSEATNLSPVVTPGTTQMYVRNLDANDTELVSRLDGGFAAPVALDSEEAVTSSQVAGGSVISGSGDYVAFGGMDPRLASGEENCCIRIYRRQITGEPAPPEVNETVQLQPDEGTVNVQIPGAIAPEELERGTEVPVGSRIDANDGSLEILSEDPDPEEPLRHMVWSDGEFVTDQAEGGAALSEAILSGPLLDCDSPNGLSPAQLRQIGGQPGEDLPLPGRKVWGKGGKGHQSKGGKSSSSVRGTEWLVWDTCDGKTVTYVVEGRVEVDDFDRDRTVLVDPGELYVAPGPPDAAITQGPTGTILNSTPSFWFGAGEDWGLYQCRIDERSWSSCSSPWTSPELDPGSHEFSVRAIDGNDSVPPAGSTRLFRVDPGADPDPDPVVPPGPDASTDSVAPTTKIVFAPSARSTSKRAVAVTIRFRSDDDDARFQCSVDGSGWRRCESPKDLRLSIGRHQFVVRAIDRAGNVDSTPARQLIRISRS